MEPPWTKLARLFLSTEVNTFEKGGSASGPAASGTLQWSHGQWTSSLWKESRGFQQSGEVELLTMIESSCSKQAGDIRWSWIMKFRMRVVECSPGTKLTDSSWPYIEKSFQKQWVFISSSKWHDVFHKQSCFRDVVQCFSGSQSHSLHDGRSEIAKVKAKARRELKQRMVKV